MHFTTADGLPSNLVNSMVQDEEGYMWFATVNGISRFDGYRFLNFSSPHNNPAFTYDNVVLLYYDRNHDIWFLTTDFRVGIINARNFTMKEVDATMMKKPAFQGGFFSEMADGRVVLQEFRGNTYRYDATGNRFVIDNALLPFPKGWHISNITYDTSIKKYWVSADMGLALYNPVTKIMNYPGHNIEKIPAIDALKNERDLGHFFIDKAHNLNFETWAVQESHPFVQSYNQHTGRHSKFNLSDQLGIAYHEIGGMLQQRSGRTWIYGATFFAEWLPNRDSVTPVLNEYRNEQSIKFDNIRAAFEDGELNVWLATDNGLFLFNPGAQLFTSYSIWRPDEKQVRELPATSVLQLPDSSILVGCWGAGLFRFDENFKPLPYSKKLQDALAPNMSIWAIHQHTKTGTIWFGLQGGDLVVYDPKTDRATRCQSPIFYSNTIRQITEDSAGNIWLGLQSGGLGKWDYTASKGDVTTGYSKIKVSPSRILKLITDTEGFLWAASYAQGLYKVDPVRQTVLQHFTTGGPAGFALTNDIVTDLLQYDDQTLIAVSKSLNFINLRSNRINHLTSKEGLPSNTGACIEHDANGVLWLGLESGLCRINRKENLFTLYNRSNGIEYDNFNPAGAFHLPDGRIVMTTDHNVLAFSPLQFLTSNFIPPTPEISAFMLSDNALSVDSLLTLDHVNLNYDNASIAIQFSILSFLKQKQPYYSYILEGFDKEWTEVKTTNVAEYSYLPPGDYTFKVIAINQDGHARGQATAIKISVHPPFWRTWWFYGVVLLLAVIMLYLLDKERQKKQQALQTVRTQIAGDLHEEINVTLNDINLLSEIAKIKADKDIDRSKDYIDQISNKSRGMIESMDDILWSIHPENDSMQRMLLRIYEFTDGIKKTNDLEVELSVDRDVNRLTLDMKTRHDFLLFYKEALQYVVQHSVCNTIYISLEYFKSKLGLKLLAQCNQLDDPGSGTAQLEYQMNRHAIALDGMLDIMSDHKNISIILQVPV